ncbi:LOW QUALITY PROTEIN: hypothetical protein HID58_094729 [Brassica napus]|uniref:NADH-quinone oxidoreductase subunit D domain-containing protein n=1 Tax=Brassica napus TaxID=3708 RepID=A0ABQ7X6B2_BRANA|nr:LOW QUALITY PROTEIN: hypothetical protein HID58_094729 [Brassica napus]
MDYDLCSLSTAYVFYKLSQIQEWKDKTLLNSEINQWKNWLRSHSQYNLPQIAWARLVTQKWKKKTKPRLSSSKSKFKQKKYNIRSIGEILHRNYLDWRILNFGLEKKRKTNQQVKKSLNQIRNKINTESALSKQEKNIEENYTESKIKKRKNKKKQKAIPKRNLTYFSKVFAFSIAMELFFNQKILNNVKAYCLLVRLKNPTEKRYLYDKNTHVYAISNALRYEDLLHIWNCTEKIIYLREVYEKFWENVNDCWLICQKKIDNLIHTRTNQGKTYEETSYRKRSYDSQYGTSPPIHARCSSLIVTLDGEDVVDCEPNLVIYTEEWKKIAENRAIIQYLPYVTRWDYLATISNTVKRTRTIRNIQVPKRASYIRVIMLELSRIASHLLWLGPFYGRYWGTDSLFYIFREREFVYDLFEAATAADLPYGWIDKCLDFRLLNIKNLLHENSYFLERVEGVGIIGGEEAINWGLSGPMLRASEYHGIFVKLISYDEFEWEIQWQKQGDSLARYLNPSKLFTGSGRTSGGPYENLESRGFDKKRNPEWNDFEYRFISKKPSPTLNYRNKNLPPKGELGIFLIGDQWVFLGDGKSDRRNEIADIMTILGSIDIIGMGEVDR